MNKEQIIKITRIMCTADNECEECAESLISQLTKVFPEYEKEITKTFEYYFNQ